MRSASLATGLLGMACVGLGCGSTVPASGFGDDGGGGGDGQTFVNPDGAPTLGDGSVSGDGNPNAACPMSTQFVYTLAEDNTLYRFDPPSLTFTSVGVLNCPGSFGPFSMAVDRKGTAWVVFTDGHVFQVNTANAACSATSYVPNQHNFMTFGMGFSSNSPGSQDETLFVSDSGFNGANTQGLAHIDLTSMTLIPIGAYDKITARAEMTGTGDARLFGAFEGMPYVVAEINKSNAMILSQAPQTAINYAPGSSNFAFAFWGGDFWLFVGPGTSTDVFQYRPSTGMTTKVKTETFVIVGAGVSTCAPTVPPK